MWWLHHNRTHFGANICFEPEDGSGAGAGGGGDDKSGAGDDKSGAGGGDDKSKGGNTPTEKEAELLREVMAKKDELKKTKEQLGTLQSQLNDTASKLKAFDGINLDEVKELLSKKKTDEEKELERKGEWDRLKTRMAEEHANETKTLKEQLDEMKKQLGGAQHTISELTVGAAFHGSKVIADELVLTPAKARVVYGGHFDIENGTVVAYDKPKGAEGRTKLVDSKGDALPFDAALKRIVDADPDRDRLMKAKIAAGAGSGTTGARQQEQRRPPVGRERIAQGLQALKDRAKEK